LATLNLEGQGHAGGRGNAGADDGIAAYQAASSVRHQHMARTAPAIAGFAPHDLGHDAARLQALAYVVGMAAVRAGDAIGPGQGGGGADAYRFLAVAAMYGPARLARLVQLAQALLQPSRQYHAAVHLQPQLQGGKIAHL